MSAAVVFKKRPSGHSNVQSTRKRVARQATPQSSDEEEEDGVIKARGKVISGLAVPTSRQSADVEINTVYSGDRSDSNKNVNDSTRMIADVDGYTEDELPGRRTQNSMGEPAARPASDQRKSSKGPMKAPTNVRAISVIDYQPDVCKDYKQTGFCGFGDTCKFLHDRGDFKQGWQLDRDWEDVAKSRKTNYKQEKPKKGEDADESTIPFKCVICKDDYKNPIITKCGHYFCESCAIQRYKKNPACAQCNAGTGGLFSGATRLKQMLAAKKSRIEAMEQSKAEVKV